MAKKNSDLFDRMRDAGLRKPVARALSEFREDAGNKAQRRVRAAVSELRSLADELERRLPVNPAEAVSAATRAVPRTRRPAPTRARAASKPAAGTAARSAAKPPTGTASRATRATAASKPAAGSSGAAKPRTMTARNKPTTGGAAAAKPARRTTTRRPPAQPPSSS